MRLTRRASLLVAFYLLTSAASAYAACAWVLRSTVLVPTQGDPGVLRRMFPVSAYESAEVCRLRLAQMRDTPDDKLESKGGSASFQCLPDTVDLRGPKAK